VWESLSKTACCSRWSETPPQHFWLLCGLCQQQLLLYRALTCLINNRGLTVKSTITNCLACCSRGHPWIIALCLIKFNSKDGENIEINERHVQWKCGFPPLLLD
jgi:hypothetical protein